MTRNIVRVVTPPPEAPGFIGEGHTAVEVVQPDALPASDPFVLLMDDRLDIESRRQIGGAHPHAGLETVTLLLDGWLDDRDEGRLDAGDAVWMTAGRGIIHSEAIETSGRSRILQLWIALPSSARAHEPRFEVVRKDAAPLVRAPGVVGRLYSGRSGTQRSTTTNIVPITMIDLAFEPRATFSQSLSSTSNGFVYVLSGDVTVGGTAIEAGRVGWFGSGDERELVLEAGDRGSRVVLYAGRPIGEPLVQRGPFVAGSGAEIADMYRRYRAGEFASMGAIARSHRAERNAV